MNLVKSADGLPSAICNKQKKSLSKQKMKRQRWRQIGQMKLRRRRQNV
ncbi:hypothetical protein AtNW77_Chr2g0228711 [Arabidopsis thaliana]